MTTTTTNPVIQRIQQDIRDNDVVLYMKGTPVFPQCGFSAAMIQVLSELGVKFKSFDVQVAQILNHLGVDFKDINVLEDMSVRDGVKAYSNWPTIPQLYVKGEFIGGCDIVREMHASGELREVFSTRGIQTQAA